MKLRYVLVENFKGIKKAEIQLVQKYDAIPAHIHAILGDNGAGKTTMLQAIALTLSLATRRTYNPAFFKWNGFLPDRLATLGSTRVELGVLFDDEEIRTTRKLFELWRQNQPSEFRDSKQYLEPSEQKEVTLVYQLGHVDCLEGPRARFQFLGRYYLKKLLETTPVPRSHFAQLGDVFWYDQNRNLGEGTMEEVPEGGPGTWKVGVGNLKRFLVNWWGYHTSKATKPGRDYISELQEGFNQIFPGTRFVGAAPRAGFGSNPDAEFFFLMERAGKTFDMEEMSSGEQSIFTLIYDFVRMDIKKSVVLIDELELHLHPPEQQGLLSNLPLIGPDCQFIVSTHSPFVEGALLDDQTTRLPGGRLCL